jgi:hypothetical protein
MYMHSFM